MLKRIILFALILLPLGVCAQELKIAYVNTGDIYSNMPETAAAEKQLVTLNQSLQTELQSMEAEYNKKYSEFVQQQDSLAQSIKIRRMQEVQDLRDRIDNFYQQSMQDAKKKQEELNAPIVQKIRDAIKAIGEEHGFTYIADAQNFIFISTKATDATPLVKTKLGMK